MRFFSLVFGVLAVCLMGLFLFKTWGDHQTYVPFDHPLMNQAPPLFFVEVETDAEAIELKAEDDNLAYVLPLHLTSDGQLIVLTETTWAALQKSEKFKKISETKPAGGAEKIQYFTLKELLDVSPAIHNLDGFLQSYPQRNFVLFISENVENIHEKVTKSIQDNNPKGSIAVATPIGVVIKSVKEIRPLTAFSLSQSDQVRALSFDSIGLVAGIDLTGDFVYSQLAWRKRPLVTKSLVNEMHRRYKKVFVGPLKTSEEIKRAQSLGVDGFIFPDLVTYKSLKNLISF